MNFRKSILSLVVAVTGLTHVAAQTNQDFTLTKGDLNLMVVSDLGRNGYYDQKPVATLMGTVSEQIGPDAVLALGDTHHYQGVQSTADPLWMTNYELIYSHPELQVEWYPVCGNHEYRGNPQAVVDYSDISRRWVMPNRYYSKAFKDGETTVRVVFLDTTPLIDKYRKKSDTYPDAVNQNPEAQIEWLEKTLAETTEDWIVIVGHHPIYAYTDKEDTERSDMQKRVDSILRKHKVDMYICGHIHNFQHIRKDDSDIDYVVNSSGSLSRLPQPTDGTVYCSGAPGFSLLTATPVELNLHMIDKDGRILHTVSRSH